MRKDEVKRGMDSRAMQPNCTAGLQIATAELAFIAILKFRYDAAELPEADW
jgi:hypothetical protein